VNILWLSTIAYAAFQATPNFFQVDQKKLVINCGNQKWATKIFQLPLWRLKVVIIITFLIVNPMVIESTFGHHA
jgi:hypothetical protein